jgi:hypothetical protein
MRMFIRWATAVILGVLWAASVPACAQQTTDVKFTTASDAIRRSEPVASQALTTLSKLASTGEYKAVGFKTADEAFGAKLGEPFPVFKVRLDQLRNYQPGTDPLNIVHWSNTVIYPVLVRETVRSSVSIEKAKDNWEAVSFGSPALIARLSTMRAQRARALPAGMKPVHFAVQVPALNLYFLGERAEKAFLMIPLWTDLQLGFESGAAMPADKAFALLMAAAKAHDGSPR